MVLERKCREALQYCRAFCIYIRNGKWVSKMRTVLDCVNAFKALLTTEIESSDFYNKIQSRIHFLPLLEKILDSNDIVFKYNKKANVFSLIEADYLIKSKMKNRNLFLFLSHRAEDIYFCRSFFPEEKMDYTKNQASWTLLYKKKISLADGTETILYNKM